MSWIKLHSYFAAMQLHYRFIDYLTQLNVTHCTSNLFLAVPECSSWRRHRYRYTTTSTKDAFIVYCNAAALQMYRLFIYCSSTQRTAPQVKINLTLLQYCSVVVGADTAIWALQLTTMQLQWTVNAAYLQRCIRIWTHLKGVRISLVTAYLFLTCQDLCITN